MEKKRNDERVRKARERAQEYKSGHVESDAGRPKEQQAKRRPSEQSRRETPVRSIEEWTDIIGQRIDEAMRRGAFENLPGRGKPQDLTRDQFVPDDQKMAFKLLQNNDLVPDWIGERNAVFEAVAKLRRQIEMTIADLAHRSAQTDDSVEQNRLRQTWQRWIMDWDEAVLELNRRILTLNLKQPTTQLEVMMLRLDDELRQQGADRHTWSI